MEVGHLMDVSRAHYLKGGHADWQAAFGLLYRRGDKVNPVVVPIQKDGSFCVEGVWYGTNQKYVTFPFAAPTVTTTEQGDRFWSSAGLDVTATAS
jgi:hypothetical protein